MKNYEQKMWEKFLNQHFCTADTVTGNRPCDDGQVCDVCNTEEIQTIYKDWLREQETGDPLVRKVIESSEPIVWTMDQADSVDVSQTVNGGPVVMKFEDVWMEFHFTVENLQYLMARINEEHHDTDEEPPFVSKEEYTNTLRHVRDSVVIRAKELFEEIETKVQEWNEQIQEDLESEVDDFIPENER